MADQSAYRSTFKSTFIFGFVQVFNIAVKVGLNKVVALLLGPSGMGMMSLYNTSIHLLSVGAGLGINQSGVRDIAEARGSNDKERIDVTITFVKRIIRYTSVFGVILMAVLSPLLSEWTFGSKKYTIAYLLLSLAVGATIQTNGYRAINTGMRELRNVAYSTIWGALAGLITGIPLYFFMGEKGIVPSLIISSTATLLIARYYAAKVKYDHIRLTFRETFLKSSDMIKMGISLMVLSFMLSAVQLIISSYVSGHGGLDIVGLYQAGATIVTSYFGIIITAMSTEYYPRIASFNQDNSKLNEAVNAQSEIGLLIALPMMVLFVFLAPYFIRFLYSDRFMSATSYLDYAILGVISTICSNSMGMVLLAKQASKIYLISSAIVNAVILGLTIILYNVAGLPGLGIAYASNGVMQFIMFDRIMWYFYRIRFSRILICTLAGTLICCGAATFLRAIDIIWLKWGSGLLLFIVVGTYSIITLNKRLNISLITKALKLLKLK